jgi:L-ascorbate metabolism protein UlaG (beta-lactamase superfamily)
MSPTTGNPQTPEAPKPTRRRALRWLLGGTATFGVGTHAKDDWLSAGPGWRGPPSDHFDGRTFFNPGLPRDGKSWLDLWRWRLSGGREPWPERADDSGVLPVSTLPAAPTAEGEVAATFVGHATYLLRWRGLTVLTDPVWSDRCSPVTWAGPKRARPPAVAWEDLPPVDLVLVSHNHYDHLDLVTLERLEAHSRPVIVTGLGNREFLAGHGLTRVVELDWWQAHEAPGARVTFAPAVHWSNRGGYGRNATLWGAFMIEAAGTRVYFGGDTGYGSHFAETRRRLGAPELALLPIGAYAPRWFMKTMHMNPEEAVRAHHDLGARRSLGLHFGTWQLTDEGIDAPVVALAEARATTGLAEEAFRAPGFGETVRATA